MEIALYTYKGALPGSAAYEKFDTFRGLLHRKILNLKRELKKRSASLNAGGRKLEYLDLISFDYREPKKYVSSADISEILENENHLLSLLQGTILSNSSGQYVAHSEFYLADLRGALPFDGIFVNLPITGEEFGNAKDSHALVILYALAMDAKRLSFEKSRVALFLSEASNLLADIERRTGTLSTSLKELKSAINTEKKDILRK